MKIGVTGGTGFVGHHLVNRLIADGHDVRILIHSQLAKDRLADSIEVIKGSVEDASSLVPFCEGLDVVVHLVGIIAETRTKTFEKTVASGTANVVAACRNCRVERILYLSALGANPNSQSEYLRTKAAAELSVIRSKLKYIIYRPSIIYGEGDGFVAMITQMMKLSPFVPIIGDGRYRLQPVYIDDLIETMVRVLKRPDLSDEIIDVGGPDQLEYVEIIRLLKHRLGKKRLNIYMPFAVMIPVARLLEMFMKPAPITRDQLVMLRGESIGDISRMVELLEREPVSLSNGLRKYLR